MNDKLPDEFYRNTLADILPGETVFVTPWSVDVLHDGTCWIRLNASISFREAGTAHLKVTRTVEGYVVSKASVKNHRYTPQDEPGQYTVGESPYAQITWED